MRSFSLFLVLLAGLATSARAQNASHPGTAPQVSTPSARTPALLDVREFAHPMLRSRLDSIVSLKAVDSFQSYTKATGLERTFVYAPVTLFDFPAILQARFVRDSLAEAKFFLTYREHKGQTPLPPYRGHDFTLAHAEDLDTLQHRMVASLGEVSVTGGNFFVYLGSDTLPYLQATWQDKELVLSAVPKK